MVNLSRSVLGAVRDLAPIIVIIAFFQIVVLQQPFPNLGEILVGVVCVVAGLALFVHGLEDPPHLSLDVRARGDTLDEVEDEVPPGGLFADEHTDVVYGTDANIKSFQPTWPKCFHYTFRDTVKSTPGIERFQ